MKEVKKQVLFFLHITSMGGVRQGIDQERTYGELYRFIPFAQSSVRSSITQLREARLVSTYARSGQTHILLTTQGRERVYDLFPALLGGIERWDGTWTILVFQKPELEVANFRASRDALYKQGFFPLRDGVYIRAGTYPDHLRSVLIELNTFQYMTVFESKRLLFSDEGELIRVAFAMDAREKAYRKMCDLLERAETYLGGNKRSEVKATRLVSQLLQEFLHFSESPLVIPDKYIPQIMKDKNISLILGNQIRTLLTQS